VFILNIDTFLVLGGGGGWKGANCDKSQGQLSTRLAKVIDFITNLIRSGGGGGGVAMLIYY
jgi:hypothetical protein